MHCIFGSAQGETCTDGHAGHGFGSGQFATGHLGRGQGGHSPILHGFEQVLMHGGHLGTDDLRTYLDISGWAGHSVFNIYLVISGIGGHGGIVDFKTYFVPSGTGHGAGGGQCSGRLDAMLLIAFSIFLASFPLLFSQLHFLLGCWHIEHILDTAGLQPHIGLWFPHILQRAIANPSFILGAVYLANK